MASASQTDICHIAILMTCHNRQLTTLRCLDAIADQKGLGNIRLQVYLVDDGCTDGTQDSVSISHPNVRILHGDGSLYWCGGMRMAWAEAMKEDYDFYLWLNDDTQIYQGAIRKLVDTSELLMQRENMPVILTGATCAPATDICTYGGVNLNGFINRPTFSKISPMDSPQRCDTINGNCTLISRDVVNQVGNLSTAFTHGIGDFDYGLRAGRLGIQCWLAGGFIGECESKSIEGSWRDQDLSIKERVHAMNQPAGLPPVSEWMIFTWRHAGWLWPICWLRSIGRGLFPGLKLKGH